METRAQIIRFPRPTLDDLIQQMEDAGYGVFSVALDASRGLSPAEQREFVREAWRLLGMALDPLPRRWWWRIWGGGR